MKTIGLSFVHPLAQFPQPDRISSPGLTIKSIEQKTIAPLSIETFRTGLKLTHMPRGMFAQLLPRRDLCLLRNLTCLAGVIDNDYRGEIMVILYNLSPTSPQSIQKGEKLCQMSFQYYTLPQQLCLDVVKKRKRGEDGFGSTD